MAYTEASIPDLTGRTAVVTGANGGLGLATTTALAGRGAHVVMAARNQGKAATAREGVLAEDPGASLEVVELDLGSLASVRGAADAVLAAHERIDILVNNAGVMAMPNLVTADGFEMQLGINHLGHWALTAHLMPGLLAADAARVVTVTSIARHQGKPVDPSNPNMEGIYDPWAAYGRAKLANFHFAIGLQRDFRAAGASAASLSAHPGLTNSELQATTIAEGGAGFQGRLWHTLARVTGMSTTAGARPQLRAATDPAAQGGELYGPRFGTRGPAVRLRYRTGGLDDGIAALWHLSERETGVALGVG